MTKPIMVRTDEKGNPIECGPSGLKLIEDLASDNKSQGTIAATLGIPRKRFERMLERNKGDCPERLAWEKGHAAFEQRMIDHTRMAAMGEETLEEVEAIDDKGNPLVDGEGKPLINEDGTPKKIWLRTRVISKANTILLMYFTKVQLGWTEKGNNATIQDNRINITLPAPTSREDMFKRLGITAPLDFTKKKAGPDGNN